VLYYSCSERHRRDDGDLARGHELNITAADDAWLGKALVTAASVFFVGDIYQIHALHSFA
jgi:hypothetical protein